MTNWISVKDKLPEDIGLYPIKSKYGEGAAFYVSNLKGDLVWLAAGVEIEVTHFKTKTD